MGTGVCSFVHLLKTWCHSLSDRNDHQPPGSSFVSDTMLSNDEWHILFGLSTHLQASFPSVDWMWWRATRNIM